MVKNTYKNITKEEKINLYLKFIDYLNYKEDIKPEQNRSNLCKTERRQERQREH